MRVGSTVVCMGVKDAVDVGCVCSVGSIVVASRSVDRGVQWV